MVPKLLHLWSEIRFSAFAEELARDSDKTFNLSTCLYNKNNVGNRSFVPWKEISIFWVHKQQSKDRVALNSQNIQSRDYQQIQDRSKREKNQTA